MQGVVELVCILGDRDLVSQAEHFVNDDLLLLGKGRHSRLQKVAVKVLNQLGVLNLGLTVAPVEPICSIEVCLQLLDLLLSLEVHTPGCAIRT